MTIERLRVIVFGGRDFGMKCHSLCSDPPVAEFAHGKPHVCGCMRAERQCLESTLHLLLSPYPWIRMGHGACPTGADMLAAEWAKHQNWNRGGEAHRTEETVVVHWWADIRAYPADWANHGKAAGPKRNEHMDKMEQPQLGIGFAGGRGTQNMLSILHRRGVQTHYVVPARAAL